MPVKRVRAASQNPGRVHAFHNGGRFEIKVVRYR